MENTGNDNTSDLKLCHGVFRINTDVSAGEQSLEDVVRYARNAGVDYIVVSDQFLVYAKYGLPPFREVIAYSMDQKSVVSYGVDKYLNLIQQVQQDYPELVIIPGVDIAPHYYWTGNPFTFSLTTNQFSEQITVFGPDNTEFYRNLPVIHNDPIGFFFPGTLIGLLPLLLTLAGISIFVKQKSGYKDRQGNTHKVPGMRRFKIFGIMLILLGILWTWNNRPFHKNTGLSQYSQATQKEYQQTLDYIRSAEKELPEKTVKPGIIWSAPEATMKEKRSYASLLSVPFIGDIKYTRGYNGFAGIYGDASTAHKSGSFWDDILSEYCNGKRKHPPIIIGERDWHGRGRLSIDFIKTVTISRSKDAQGKSDIHSIVDAICNGRSYAVLKTLEKEVVLTDVRLSNSKEPSAGFCIPGETFQTKTGEVTLKIAGNLIGKNVSKGNNPGSIIVVVNGEKVFSENVELSNFKFEKNIPVKTDDWKKHYVRFYIMTHSTVVLICNPIFVEKKE